MLHGCFRRCRHGARYRIGLGFLLACKCAFVTIIGEFASGRPEIFELCPTVFYSLLLPFAFLCRPTSYIQRYMYHFCSLGLLLGAFRMCTAAMSILYFVFAIGALRQPLCNAMFICCGNRFHIWHAGIAYQMRSNSITFTFLPL